MKSVILGTGASEAIPCLFCNCPVCERARREKGKEIRTRSAMMVNENTMIDFSRDAFHQFLETGLNLNKLQNMLLTHFHDDHFNIGEMICRLCADPALTEPVKVWLSREAAEEMRLMWKRYHTQDWPEDVGNYFTKYQLEVMEPFHDYEMGDLTVTPLLSSHHGYGVGEIGYNCMVSKPSGRFLYAVDTGWYPQETWQFLTGKPIDYIVMECTYGDRPLPKMAQEHLNIDNALDMLTKLRDIGCISEATPVFLTHICHAHSLSHEETNAFLKARTKFSVQAAFDGMELPF